MKTLLLWLLLSLSLLHCSAGGNAEAYSIGVFYYPGWSPGIKGPKEPDPWAAIKAYPERQPRLGWYNDGLRTTLEQQLAWMADHSIDFVVFDWYWENAKAAPETSVSAYLQADARRRVHYALLWANHGREPRSLAEWDALTNHWLDRHLRNAEYLRIDGKPVLFVFSPDVLRDQSKAVGLSVKEMLDRARDRAVTRGLPGIYFVLCVQAVDYWVRDFAPKAGFDALSAYNYQSGVAGDAARSGRPSESFDELDQGYRTQWKWITQNSSLPYFPVMTSGWDRRPWGGSREPKHDQSVSTPDSFEGHLRAARALMDAQPAKTRRTGLICCWNEYGEGSYIEPTQAHGMAYLERIKKVFGGGS